MQHNLEKLRRILDYVIKAAMWLLGATFMVLIIKPDIVIEYSTIPTIINVLSFILVSLIKQFDKKLWKYKYINKYLPEKFWTPIIEGRWEGTLNRNREDHKFVIEIVQSFTSVSCRAYSRHSSSASIISEMIYNEQLKTYQLVFYWKGQTSNTQEGTGDTNRFDGFTVLDIVLSDKEAVKLVGSYFTDRQPHQTKGKIDLHFRQKELKNSFE